jgi:hypothetical protein
MAAWPMLSPTCAGAQAMLPAGLALSSTAWPRLLALGALAALIRPAGAPAGPAGADLMVPAAAKMLHQLRCRADRRYLMRRHAVGFECARLWHAQG